MADRIPSLKHSSVHLFSTVTVASVDIASCVSSGFSEYTHLVSWSSIATGDNLFYSTFFRRIVVQLHVLFSFVIISQTSRRTATTSRPKRPALSPPP